MKFSILTLFPEIMENYFNTSILKRACENDLISAEFIQIRDFSLDKHKKTDDYTYGGGAGMLMSAQPVMDAFLSVADKDSSSARVIYTTPQGKVFDQKLAEELSKEEHLIFLCGHYEGIDERVLDEIVTDRISIGDYVLTGGELPVLVIADSVSRLVPGVLNNEDSSNTESFENGLLEYPQYTRPAIWNDMEVPSVLLSGDHKKIAMWRLEQSIRRTKEMRPDLFLKYSEEKGIDPDLQNLEQFLKMEMKRNL